MVTFNITKIESTDSTNEFLKNLLTKEDCLEGTTIITSEQTNGKGQQGNSWESEKEKNLTFSFILKPKLQAHQMFMVSKVVSLAMVDLLNNLKTNFNIKWPNDIYFENKKIAGILIENQLLGSSLKHSLIGIGLNVNQNKFISNAPNPVSLLQILKKEQDLNTLLQNYFSMLNDWYAVLQKGNFDLINEHYKNQLYRISGFHKYSGNNEVFEAKIIDVKEDGLLLLKTKSNETRSFYFKEVEYCLPD